MAVAVALLVYIALSMKNYSYSNPVVMIFLSNLFMNIYTNKILIMFWNLLMKQMFWDLLMKNSLFHHVELSFATYDLP